MAPARGGCVALVAAAVAGWAACHVPPPPAGPGQGAAPARASALTQAMAAERSRRVQRVAYRLWFSLDAGRTDYDGRATIDFELAPGSSGDLELDFQDGTIRALAVDGSSWSAERIAARYDGVRVRLDPEDLRPGAANRVEIAFVHPFSTTGNGLHRFADPADGRVYTYTNFEPYNANRMFPCFDQPDLKASFELEVEAPGDWSVVSNAAEREVVRRGDRAHWSFERSAPFSTYLFALHAGPWAAWQGDAGGIPMRLFARRSLARYVDHAEWLEVTRRGLAYYGTRFAHPYPFGKYDQLIVPDFNAGAMENVAAVTFSERYVSRSRITEDARRDRANTILHEMAHMWFGDLVTMRWWNGLWLNESFASWAAAGAVEDATRFGGGWHDFFVSMKRWAYWEDQLVTTHPIEVAVLDTDQAFALFDGITYGKGASVLKQLAYFLGEDAFRSGLRLYFERFAYRSTELADFIAALADASGRDLSGWEAAWLERPGVNGLEASWSCAAGAIDRLVLRQTPSEFDVTLRPHRTRVGLYSTHSGTRQGDPIAVAYAGAETPVPDAIGRACPDFVYPNDGDYDYAKVTLDPASLGAIRSGGVRFEDPLLRQQVWYALWEMVVDGRLPAADYAELALAQIGAERDTLVLGAVLGRLAQSDLGSASILKYLPDARRERLRERIEHAFREGLASAPAGSDRQLVWFFALLEVARSPESVALLSGLLDGSREIAGLEVDQDRRWELIVALARAGAPDAPDRIARELEADATDTGRKRAIAAEASIPSAAVKGIWRARIAGEAGYEPLPDAQLRPAMRAFHALGREDLAALSVDWFFDTLPGFAATRDEDLVDAFAASMFPALCDERIVRRVDALLASGTPLPASAQKHLRVARQEELRCIRARRLQGGAEAESGPG